MFYIADWRVAHGHGTEKNNTLFSSVFCVFKLNVLSVILYLHAVLWMFLVHKLSIHHNLTRTLNALGKAHAMLRLPSCSAADMWAGKLCNDKSCATRKVFACFTSLPQKRSSSVDNFHSFLKDGDILSDLTDPIHKYCLCFWRASKTLRIRLVFWCIKLRFFVSCFVYSL